ncbi:MAG: lytic transglycosylase domain-containing protein [Candidatus Gastranaerophilales bacterium]|nr:lytic transglycosylase domain-containing protein [Candidatus Gastranaerophilales bacterium]
MSISKTSGKKTQTYMDGRMNFKPGKSKKYSPKGALELAKERAEKAKERSSKAAKEDAEREQKRAQEYQSIVNSAANDVYTAYQNALFAELKKQAKAEDAARLDAADESDEVADVSDVASVSMNSGATLKTKSASESQYSDLINKYAAQYNLDPNMVSSIITIESSWDPNATSSANCKGLMQCNPKYVSGNLYDPETSIREGCRIFRECLDAYDGDVAHALVAYNAGISGAKGKPTSAYSDKVLAEYNTRKPKSLDVMA